MQQCVFERQTVSTAHAMLSTTLLPATVRLQLAVVSQVTTKQRSGLTTTCVLFYKICVVLFQQIYLKGFVLFIYY